MHRSRDTVHVQWLQMHCQCYPMANVRTHSSTTDTVGSSKMVEGLTTWSAICGHCQRSRNISAARML